MFEISRSLSAPTDLLKGKYNTISILNALSTICYSKCYLCENDEVQEVEVEHFLPKDKHPNLEFSWDNLFYSCKRCNRIKSNNHEHILDPCKPQHKVFRNIHLGPPSRASDKIIINNFCHIKDSYYSNTVETINLLEKCFNDTSTPARRISRRDLVNRLLDGVADILEIRARLKSKKCTPFEESENIERLKNMTSPNYAFSAFWRWYVLDDELLLSKMEPYINF